MLKADRIAGSGYSSSADARFPLLPQDPLGGEAAVQGGPDDPADFPTPSPATNRFGTFVSRYRSVTYFVS